MKSYTLTGVSVGNFSPLSGVDSTVAGVLAGVGAAIAVSLLGVGGALGARIAQSTRKSKIYDAARQMKQLIFE
jgi:hypothetical protein